MQNPDRETAPTSIEEESPYESLDTMATAEHPGKVWAKMVVPGNWTKGASNLLSELRPQTRCVLRLQNSTQNKNEGNQVQHRACNTEPKSQELSIFIFFLNRK